MEANPRIAKHLHQHQREIALEFNQIAERHARPPEFERQTCPRRIRTHLSAGTTAGDLVNEMRRRRVLISASGPLDNVLKIRPPLPFSVADAEELINSCDTVMDQLSARR
jgi:acetylornithine/succinyldiaminopimelate/putrescine aminotransferase